MRRRVFGLWLRPQVTVQLCWWALTARCRLAWRLFKTIVERDDF